MMYVCVRAPHISSLTPLLQDSSDPKLNVCWSYGLVVQSLMHICYYFSSIQDGAQKATLREVQANLSGKRFSSLPSGRETWWPGLI